MPQDEVGWKVISIHQEPTAVVKLYLLVLFASFFVAAVQLVRFWRTARTLKRSERSFGFDTLLPLRNRARSIKQWMLLDCLVWSLSTTYGLGNVVKGVNAQGAVGLSVMLDVFWELCQPLILLLWVMLALFLARWHMRWRIERFEAEINSAQKT